MLTWQFIIVLQILASSFLAIWTRHVSIRSRKYVFAVGLISYACIAIMGLAYSIFHNGSWPALPQSNAWLYLMAEGIFIPAAWLFQFKLVSHIGASNGVISSTINGLGAAFLGILILGETISIAFIVGSLLILAAVYLSLTIKPDNSHPVTATLSTKVLLVVSALVCFSLGMLFEKQAITAIGVWNYALYGWSMQLVGAFLLYKIFGNKELASIPKPIFKKAVALGILTSVAGLLFILALSLGSLSHTIVATSGKIAITMVMAAIFLHERNNMLRRLAAFMLAILGILFILL